MYVRIPVHNKFKQYYPKVFRNNNSNSNIIILKLHKFTFTFICTFPFNYFAQNFELDDDNNQQQQLQNHYQRHEQLQQQQQQHHHQEQQQQSSFEELQSYTNNRLEEFMPNNLPSPTDEHSWESIENVNENINMNEHYPVDLSNDIAINQIAADQGVPYESDAEYFTVDDDEHDQYPISTTYEFVPVDIKK